MADKKLVHVAAKVEREIVAAFDKIAKDQDITRAQLLRRLVKREVSERAVQIVQADAQRKS